MTKSMGDKVTLKMVTLKEPCTACVILDGLLKEMLEKLRKKNGNIEVEIVELDHIRDVYDIEGVEVEKFPLLLINGEQVTAGTLPSQRRLMEIINLY